MNQALSVSSLAKLSALAAVGITVAAVGLACSSSSSPPPTGNTNDASSSEPDGATPEDVATPPSMPCDAAIVLPTDGGAAGACGSCLATQCMSELSICQNEGCECVSNIECLAANSNSFTTCTDALSAIASSSPGLTALQKCIVNSCMVCNPSSN